MSKRIALLSAAAFAALALTATIAAPVSAQEKTVMVGGAAMFPSKNIIQNAVNSKDHTTLVAAVKAAGLVETLEALGEAVVIGLLRRFALIDTISVGVSKFSPPIPHTLSKVGIAVRLARADLAGRPAEEVLEALV